jgi:hypothetical protein
METVISITVASFTLLVILIVEKIMYRVLPTKKDIVDYQRVLNEMDAKANAKHGFSWKHDAMVEIMKQRKQTKCFTLIFSGILLVIVLILLVCITTLSLINIGIICISGIVLICYGLIKIAESKKLALGVLSSVFIVGTLMMFIFDKLMAMSPYAYFYLCGLILLLGIFSLIPKFKKRV